MTDNKEDRGAADRSRINVNEDYEVRYWTKKFGVSEEELIAAVTIVGVRVDQVEAYFNSRR
jgi:hypothetical protein